VLQDYVMPNYLHHIRGALKGDAEKIGELGSLVQSFLKARWNESFMELDQGRSSTAMWLLDTQQTYAREYQQLNTIAAFTKKQEALQEDEGLYNQPNRC
jgi:hypothetical protein